MWRYSAQVFRKITLFHCKCSPAKPWLPGTFWFFVETLLRGYKWGIGWHFESDRTRNPLDLHKPVKLISYGIWSHRNTKNTACWRVTPSLVRRSCSGLQKPANVNSFFSREEHHERIVRTRVQTHGSSNRCFLNKRQTYFLSDVYCTLCSFPSRNGKRTTVIQLQS